MKKTWYYKEGSKKAELWTILHLPYTLMCISFLIVGFAIQKPINYEVMIGACIAYFFGLGISAHSLDQLPGMGSTYVKFLTTKELLILAITSMSIAIILGLYYIFQYQAIHLLWLMPLQAFFAIAYPVSKLFKGFFHNDFWFGVAFGAIPVVVGYYANNLTFSLSIIPFSVLCFLIAEIEITLSRHSRSLRKQIANSELRIGNDIIRLNQIDQACSVLISKPERSLKLLCLMSYALAISMIWR